jgi:acetolactate synthase-1/2/3 large subunit
LKTHGIDCLFVNSGTDFPPIIEAFARAGEQSEAFPRPMVVPHEHVALGMAHGYYAVTGRPQAVMFHVNVGTANAICALINAYRDDIPVLLTSGRTPLTENGPHGTRNRHIHWAQEMFDQAGMLRESVKWDHELRAFERPDEVVARALEVAMSHPRGPVYLSLPREVLAAKNEHPAAAPRRWSPAAPTAPNPEAIGMLAEWIAAARNPLIITGAVGRDPAAVEALGSLAERFALPVSMLMPRYLCLPTDHPMNVGYAPGERLADSDLLIVLDTDVPWIPSLNRARQGARVVHIAHDPVFASYPVRGFPNDLAIAADPALALAALATSLSRRIGPDDARILERRSRIAGDSARQRAQWAAEADRAGRADAITPAWISKCIADVVDDETLIFNEYNLRLEQCPRRRPGTYFALSPAGGLGWSITAALGAKVAQPDKFVIATIGDGAYIFANPTACHWVSDAHKLPILTVVFNNAIWGAVRRATLDMYGQGAAAQDGGRLLADLSPSPAFEKVVEAQGGHGERVERPADLPAALGRAVAAVRGGRQALLNVICAA